MMCISKSAALGQAREWNRYALRCLLVLAALRVGAWDSCQYMKGGGYTPH